MKPSYQIESFGKDTQIPVRDLSELQARLIPRGTVALLGRRFMERFYYRFLPADGSVFGFVAYVNEKPAGLIVVTHEASGFMRLVVLRHWFSLAWVLFSSVVANPRKWADAFEGWRLLRNRPDLNINEPAGEILTIGVLPEYRDSEFVRQTGFRIAADLLDKALAELRALGLRVFRACIESDNREVKLFYLTRGWVIEQSEIEGDEIDYVEIVLRE